MRKIIKYPLIFLITGIVLLTALSIDNMFWVTASPEWDTVFTVHNSIGHWTGPVNEYSQAELWSYLLQYRVFTVWTHPRDIGAAALTGLLVMLFVVVRDLRRKR